MRSSIQTSGFHIPYCILYLLLFYPVASFDISTFVPCWMRIFECCDKPWLLGNQTYFAETFRNEVVGQHIAQEHIQKWLFSHLDNPEPSKALVLSFHGWTGNGKNFVAKIIANALYRKGMTSKYVHYFFSTLHFPKEAEVDIYKLRVQDWIRGNVSQCERSMFVFDEIDKMPVGLLDAIKPFVDYHQEIDGVNYRKSTFLFLSNTGGKKITQKSFDLWKDGRNRKGFTYRDFEKLIQMGAFNEKGGLFHGDLIDRSLIDLYVPFLPMEKTHVEKCAEAEFKRRGFKATAKEIEEIADQIEYWPPEYKLYSTTGCKRVAQLVSVKLQEREIQEYMDSLDKIEL